MEGLQDFLQRIERRVHRITAGVEPEVVARDLPSRPELVEEVIRQAIPAREGRPDVSAGNLVGTVIYFVLFNLGYPARSLPL